MALKRHRNRDRGVEKVIGEGESEIHNYFSLNYSERSGLMKCGPMKTGIIPANCMTCKTLEEGEENLSHHGPRKMAAVKGGSGGRFSHSLSPALRTETRL